jgi:hypothetical protein
MSSSVVLALPSEMNLELPGQAIQESTWDRRADVEAKQLLIAELLERTGCEGLLVLDQANLAWLSAGGVARNVLDAEDLPALYYNRGQRWLLASSVDSQRLFDEEVDQLGYLLKEWPWHARRQQVLADLLTNRKIATDLASRGTVLVNEELRRLRRAMTAYERACYRLLGQIVTHAVEATCRTAVPGDTERELAGQVSHRLLRRGAVPLAIAVTADGRARTYRRHAFTSAPVLRSATISATARKYGLHATATRTFTFETLDDQLKREHLAACRVAATYAAASWSDAVPKDVLAGGKRVCDLLGFEHEWQAAPPGHVTGRQPVEKPLFPEETELLGLNWVVVWSPSVGAATCGDTYLISEQGPRLLTPVEMEWPLVAVRVSGAEVICPHVLERREPVERNQGSGIGNPDSRSAGEDSTGLTHEAGNGSQQPGRGAPDSAANTAQPDATIPDS